MYKKLLFTVFMIMGTVHFIHAQELAATITIQSSKVDNQVDSKIFPQLQTQLKDWHTFKPSLDSQGARIVSVS
jgi:hypothetical protein